MKTTLDLPDELMRAIKVRAAQQGRKMKDVVTELLRSGLSQTHSGAPIPTPRRVQVSPGALRWRGYPRTRNDAGACCRGLARPGGPVVVRILLDAAL
ncbi:hypothetical protein MRGA327_16020 [Mycobacterium tuberculosis RGTB327]|nr:hypothetical protein MRGA327_16020 [Mycobacterium tuberculosis RGTB327]